MKKNTRFVIVALLLVVFTFVAWIEGKRGSQYRLGMTIAEVRSLTASRYPTQKFGLDYDGQPTLQQMSEDALFYIHDQDDEGVLLMFNHFEQAHSEGANEMVWCERHQIDRHASNPPIGSVPPIGPRI